MSERLSKKISNVGLAHEGNYDASSGLAPTPLDPYLEIARHFVSQMNITVDTGVWGNSLTGLVDQDTLDRAVETAAELIAYSIAAKAFASDNVDFYSRIEQSVEKPVTFLEKWGG